MGRPPSLTLIFLRINHVVRAFAILSLLQVSVAEKYIRGRSLDAETQPPAEKESAEEEKKEEDEDCPNENRDITMEFDCYDAESVMKLDYENTVSCLVLKWFTCQKPVYQLVMVGGSALLIIFLTVYVICRCVGCSFCCCCKPPLPLPSSD